MKYSDCLGQHKYAGIGVCHNCMETDFLYHANDGLFCTRCTGNRLEAESPAPPSNINCATPCDVSGLLARWCLDNEFNPTITMLEAFVARLNAACGTSHN